MLSNAITREALLQKVPDFVSKLTVKTDGCMEWGGAKNGGYGQLRVWTKRMAAHRFSYMLFKGDIPDGMIVCHVCDNPSCCNPNHLILGTCAENSADMAHKNNGGSWDKKIDRDKILFMVNEGLSQSEAARRLGCSQSLISRIIKGKR